MMNRGILNPIQHIYEPPVVADCFEADIEAQLLGNAQTGEDQYVVFPPLFGFTIRGLALSNPDDIFYELPPMNVNVYVDGELVGTVVQRGQSCTQDTMAEIASERMTSIMQQIDMMNTCVFDEYGVHRVKIEPVENIAGRAKGLGYVLIGAMGSTSSYITALTLIQQPSNRAYYETEDNVGDLFKFAQFSGTLIRNPVVVEPIPDVQFRSANYAYYGQFLAATISRVTITAQNAQNAPEGWRMMSFAGNISQLVIQGKIMDANVTGNINRWNMLKDLVGEYGLHIYVDKDLVDDYKALNETIAPYVFSDEVIPDPPVTIDSGVYHNPTLGLISVRNNTRGTCITFADKNLGATRVYNNGNTLSQENCGYFYQRGNNHGFPWGDSGSVAAPTSSTQVDTTGYGPGNYYNQDLFIAGNNDWSSVDNPGLWGDLVQGPCPNGFHIMSISDVDRYHSVINGISRQSGLTSFMMLHMPPQGAVKFDGAYDNTRPCYWLGTPTIYTGQSWILNTPTASNILTRRMYRAYGGYIRPVKDEPVIPDETWIKLY